MKKTLLSIALVATGLVAFAQKPAAGDKTAETSLNFQTGTAGISYGAPELRLRYFLNEGMAVRLRLNLGSSSTTNKYSDGGSPAVVAEEKIGSGFTFAISPGIEKHFAGTDKLSPYVGAQLPISFNSGATVEVTDASAASPTAAQIKKGDKYSSTAGSTFSLGLGLLIGADYYFTDAVYLGGEMGLGIFSMSSTGDSKVSSTTNGTAVPEVTSPGPSSLNILGIMPTGGVRLGFKF